MISHFRELTNLGDPECTFKESLELWRHVEAPRPRENKGCKNWCSSKILGCVSGGLSEGQHKRFGGLGAFAKAQTLLEIEVNARVSGLSNSRLEGSTFCILVRTSISRMAGDPPLGEQGSQCCGGEGRIPGSLGNF